MPAQGSAEQLPRKCIPWVHCLCRTRVFYLLNSYWLAPVTAKILLIRFQSAELNFNHQGYLQRNTSVIVSLAYRQGRLLCCLSAYCKSPVFLSLLQPRLRVSGDCYHSCSPEKRKIRTTVSYLKRSHFLRCFFELLCRPLCLTSWLILPFAL